MAAEERAKALREANTLDRVAPGEQQPEVEHDYSRARTATPACATVGAGGGANGFNTASARAAKKSVDLSVTYWGGDAGRAYDILVNGELVATETLAGAKPNQFIEKRYSIPAKFLDGTVSGRVIIRFTAKSARSAGIYDVRLLKSEARSGTATTH